MFVLTLISQIFVSFFLLLLRMIFTGWNEVGVDPSAYSRCLMTSAYAVEREAVRASKTLTGSRDPVDLLQKAYAAVCLIYIYMYIYALLSFVYFIFRLQLFFLVMPSSLVMYATYAVINKAPTANWFFSSVFLFFSSSVRRWLAVRPLLLLPYTTIPCMPLIWVTRYVQMFR